MGILDQWNKPTHNLRTTIKRAMNENKSLLIKYRKFDGDFSERKLSKIEYNNKFDDEGFHNDHIKAYCNLRNEERTFKISRIISVELLDEK